MGQDPRVAWSDAWHMWSDAPRRLGWKLTSAQLEQLERQRDAALIRRAAKRSTRHDGDARTISGPRAEETPPTEHEPGVPAHGINRSRQQMAEAMAAEERADKILYRGFGTQRPGGIAANALRMSSTPSRSSV